MHRSAISADVFHFLHQFYEMIAHILNTLIFAIAGAELGYTQCTPHAVHLHSCALLTLCAVCGAGAKLGLLMEDGTQHELWANYGWQIIMIYPIVLFARGLAIVVFYPLLRRTGTGCTWQEAVVIWWGGLRGSVGLALALVVSHTAYDRRMWGDGQGHTWCTATPCTFH